MEITEVIQILKTISFPEESGLCIIKEDDVETINQKDYITASIDKAIDDERQHVIKEVEEYLATQISKTPLEMLEEVFKLNLKVQRLILVINPYVSKVNFLSGKKNYDMGKILWLNDKNEKVRISRTYGSQTKEGLVDQILKYMERIMGGYDDIQKNHMLMVKIKNTKYLVDLSKSNKEAFITTAAKLELWNLYKETY